MELFWTGFPVISIRASFDLTWNMHLLSGTLKFYRGEIAALESVQKFALQVCLKSWDTNYDELLSAADIPSLQHRRIQQSLCHLFKIINGLIDFLSAYGQAKIAL